MIAAGAIPEMIGFLKHVGYIFPMPLTEAYDLEKLDAKLQELSAA